MINHAIQDQFPPGSIFKIVTAVAGLAEGAITPDTRIYSPGVLEVHNELSPGIIYRFGDTTQGVFNIRTALAESSNVFFYYVAGGDPYRNPDNPPRHPSEQERLDDLADDGIVAGDVQFVGAGNEALAQMGPRDGLRRADRRRPGRRGRRFDHLRPAESSRRSARNGETATPTTWPSARDSSP